jgi:methylated-DNA-[protein]-cysteine S-methyltransferase
MTDLAWTTYDSPLGTFELRGGPRGLAELRFPGRSDALDPALRDPAPFAGAIQQLDEHFAGRRQAFELELDLRGTPFQLAVWERLRAIPYGETTTYGALARELGRIERVRAVGAAVGRTPVPIIVPCHRVIGADGSLTGYGGGLDRKRALLDLERRVAGRPERAAAPQLALL